MEEASDQDDYAKAWQTAREIVGTIREDSDDDFQNLFPREEQVEPVQTLESKVKTEGDEQNNSETAVENMEIDEVQKEEQEEKVDPFVPPLGLAEGEKFFESVDDASVVIEFKKVDGSDSDDDVSISLASEDSDEQLYAAAQGRTSKCLDLQLLVHILDQSKEATASINENSDVVILVGGTGVGKSTFIQALSGKKIIPGWDDVMSKPSYIVDQSEEVLQDFEIGHGLTSCTRHLRSYFHEASGTHWVDSSGFGDTQAIETDIATSICIKEVAQQAGKLRFVVLINANQFYCDRAGELKRNLDVIAKLIGHNFLEHKKRFTFLFTHCNNAFEKARDLIKESSDHDAILSSMKKTLIKLLTETKKATPDASTRDLIRFLKKSLEEGLPFCNVFDPIFSDVAAISRDAEPATAEKAFLKPGEYVHCSLTILAEHSIDQEVKRIQKLIVDKIHAGQIDSSVLQDILVIRTLASHVVPRTDVVGKVSTFLSEALLRLQDDVHGAVARGTKLDDQVFGLDDAIDVRKNILEICFLRKLVSGCHEHVPDDVGATITQCKEYGNLISVLQDYSQQIERDIDDLNNFLCGTTKMCPSLQRLLVRMEKLSFWTVAFEYDVSELSGCVKARFQQFLLTLKIKMANVTLQASLEDCGQAIRTFVILNEIGLSGLSKSCFEDSLQEDFCHIFHGLLVQTKEVLGSLASIVQHAAKEAFQKPPTGVISINGSNLPVNMVLCEVMKNIRIMDEIIRTAGIQSALCGYNPHCSAMVICTSEFHKASQICLALISHAGDLTANTIKLCLYSLRIFANSVGDQNFLDHVTFLETRLCLILRQMVDTAVVRSSDLNTLGFARSVHLHSQPIKYLIAFVWADSLSQMNNSAEQPSIDQAVRKAILSYSKFASTQAESASTSFAVAIQENTSFDSIYKHLSVVADSLDSLGKVCLISEELKKCADAFIASLDEKISTWLQSSAEKKLPKSILDLDIESVTRKGTIAEQCRQMCCDEVQMFRATKAAASNLLSSIQHKFEEYQSEIKMITAPPIKFGMAAKLLEKTSGLTDLPFLVNKFPSPKTISNSLLDHLQEQAEDIDMLLKSTPEDLDMDNVESKFKYLVDGIEQLGEPFETVKVIVVPLRLSIEMRKLERDTRFKTFVEDDDFAAVAAYLGELKSSQNIDHYRQCLRVLSSRLWSLVESICFFVDKLPDSMSGNVQVLEQKETLQKAVMKLSGALATLPPPSLDGASWDLNATLKNIEKSVSSALTLWIGRTHKAIEDLEYATAFFGIKACRVLCQFTSDTNANILLMQTEKDVLALFLEPCELVDEFLETLSGSRSKVQRRGAKSMSPPKTKMLFFHLTKLKMAATTRNSPEEVIKLYGMAKEKLSTGLCDLRINLEQEWNEGRYVFSLAVLDFLRKHIRGGLHGHVCLDFDVDRVFDEVLTSKAEHERKFQSSELNEKEVNRIAEELERLNKQKTGFWSSWFGRGDYEDLRSNSEKKVHGLLEEVVNMTKNCQFRGLHNLVSILRLVDHKLGGHVKGIRGLSIGEVLVSNLQTLFDQFHTDMRLALLSGNIVKLSDVIFPAFLELMSEIQQIEPLSDGVPDVIRACSCDSQGHVNRLIREHCMLTFAAFDSALENLDFVKIHQLTRSLQELGFFMVMQFQHYLVECCSAVQIREIDNLIRMKFASGKPLEIGRSLAMLRLPLDATPDDIKRAYRKITLLTHPDKNRGCKRSQEQFIAVKNACDLLEEYSVDMLQRYDFLFLLEALRKIPELVRRKTNQLLEDGMYQSTLATLSSLDNIDLVLMLVKDHNMSKWMDQERMRNSIMDQVKRHGHGLAVEVKTSYSCKNFVPLHHSFAQLQKFERAFKSFHEIVGESLTSKALAELRTSLEELSERCLGVVSKSEEHASRAMDDFAKRIVAITQFMDGFPPLKMDAYSSIQSILDTIQGEAWGPSFIFKLGLRLENGGFSEDDEGPRLGKVVVESFPHFQDVRTVVFNREVVTADINECLTNTNTQCCDSSGNMQTVYIANGVLQEEVEKYSRMFDQNFCDFVQEGPDKLVSKVLGIVNGIKRCSVSTWNSILKGKITEILAGVFATFTIIKSGQSFQRFKGVVGNGKKADAILFRPHKIQIIAIFRLLGIGTKECELPNHIMEIRTGEGKSIVLGALSVVLSLLGFSVRCISYSEHLSERDEELFQDVFIAFGISKRIKYSTIDQMAMDKIAQKGNIRKLATQLIRANCRPSSAHSPFRITESTSSDDSYLSDVYNPWEIQQAHQANCPLPLNGEEILLIDEVDVFFGNNFYGNTHNPGASIQEPLFKTLMMKVWNSRYMDISFATVSSWTEYKDLLTHFSNWELQIQKEVFDMVSDVHHFNFPEYEFDPVGMRIGYRNLDSVAWYRIYGYRTKFACIYEIEKRGLKGSGPAADNLLRESLSMRLCCGQFSYANIEPSAILGVSGTLGATSKEERLIMNDLHINTFSIVPSVYGTTNLTFDRAGRGIIIESEPGRHMQTIANEMKQAIDQGRSAIAFFEDDTNLSEFQQSKYWKTFRYGNVLLSTTGKEERKYIINKAATSGQVTISTAIFGRGTDFFSKDSKLENSGGMLVIQTFLSVEKSEELQIQGRTARQGKKGSYCMVLLENNLIQKFGVAPNKFASVAKEDLYDFLDTCRISVHDRAIAQKKKKVRKATELDFISRAFLNALVAGDYEGSRAGLDMIYKFHG